MTRYLATLLFAASAVALRFEREVELQVAESAVVGPIEGVAPRRVQ
jgi:hypothetical protein